jgi:antitoxin component of RelBE/YafQ-DinJ toxin-antitoxin module
MRIGTDLYEEAHRIAEMRGQTVDDVVARVLRKYAQGRTRPRD